MHHENSPMNSSFPSSPTGSLILSAKALNISENTDSAPISGLARLLRSTAFRLGIIFSLIYLVAFSISSAVFYKMMQDRIIQHLDRSLVNSYENLNEVYQELGIEAVVQLSKSKDNIPMQDSMGFHLSSSDGQRLAGNIPFCPTEQGWFEVDGIELGLSTQTQYRFYGAKLGDHIVSLGRSLDTVSEMRQHAYAGFTTAFLIATALALLGATFMSYRIRCRIFGITSSMDRVASGDLSARIPVGTTTKCDIDDFSIKINDALNQLEMNVEGMRQVSSDIAHDLKTPLNRLHISLEQAFDKLQDKNIVNDELQSALDEAQSINTTFAALLRIAQIEAGDRRARFKTVDLTQLMENVAEIYEPVAEESGQKLILATEAEKLEIWGEAALLTQVLANLIENSIRHCPEQTMIKLEAGRSDQGIWLSVSDNGPGIPIELHQKVFQRLYRVQQHRQTPGTGLGLSLVKAVAELHCGSIIIDDNAPGVRVLIQFEDCCNNDSVA